jgi:predicted Mrr-cat superfamily restriction endonuclease
MMWMVRTPGGKYAQELLKMGIVAIGWAPAAEQLSNAQTTKEFYAVIRKIWPAYAEQKIINTGSQLYKFFRVMKEAQE